MGVGCLYILNLLNLNELATLEIYYQNNPFLYMVQLKFCLNTFETCSLMYVCVPIFSILAIILFEYMLLDPSAKRGPILSRGLQNFRGARSPCLLLPAPMGHLQA